MKIKYFALLTMCLTICALGCACKGKEEQPDSVSSSTPPSSSSDQTIQEEQIEPVISLNQSAVTFCVGETFTLVAEVDNMHDALFSWAIDGDSANDVVSLSQTGNTAVITALKAGTTKLVASVKYDEGVYFKTVDVVVNESTDVNLVLSNNVGFDNDGYYVKLSTLSTKPSEQTSLVPLVSVYKNNKLVPNVAISWESDDSGIVEVKGNNQLTSVSEGKTYVVGTCEVDEKEYKVRILVEVCRPTVALNEKFVIERENLSALTVSSTLGGVVKDVVYNGNSVGSYDMQSKTITLEKSKLPKVASEMGENKQLFIETNLARYALSVDMYTKILNTKEDFDTFASLSKSAYSSNDAIWDGYFVLGSDIAYNGVYKSKIADLDSLWKEVEGNWFNGGLYGFRGVFDGKGHNIEGISIDNGAQLGSIFGVLHIDGVIKNVSFTKASVAANSSLVCGAGGGSVENVYVQYDSIGDGAQHYEGDGSINSYCATFFGFKEPTATANVSNCVVDVTNATFNTSVAIKLIGSEYATIKNAFVIGGTKELQKNSNATLTFDAVIDFVEDKNAQMRYQKFDEGFWSFEKGVPVSQGVYQSICGQDVAFQEKVSCLVSGTSYKFVVSNSFVKITSDNENVSVTSGVARIAEGVTNGETVTITAVSIFDESKSASFTCLLAAVSEIVDLTKENQTAFYDLTLNKIHFADLKTKVAGEVLYYLNSDYTSATYGKDGDAAKTLIAVTQDKLYKFSCISVMKVIEKAEDLHYIRKDYTVTSYGNDGCYDGKILGTFVLVNDIDCTGLVLKNTGRYWENSRGFAGTFDGRGYTISNLMVGENGLFGALAYATIKDVKFTGVRLVGATDGTYVSLFASRVFNTTVENVEIEFVQYTVGAGVYSTSGLMFYETSFDCTFKNITINISQISGVKYLTECYYDADVPYQSNYKSKYENITVIVGNLEDIPVFAYKEAKGTLDDVEEYPVGFIFMDTNGNVKE